MKKYIITLSVLFNGLFLFPGCGVGVEVVETLYLGDAKVNAPIKPPPVHLNINSKPGDITISPKISFTNKKNMTAASTDAFKGSILRPDSTVYKARKENLEWNYSRYTFGLDLDFKVSNSVALFGGMSVSDDNYLGGNTGIGFFTHSNPSIVRFDIGLNIQQYGYDAITIVQGKINYYGEYETSYRYLLNDNGKEININPFISMTINSSYDSSLINYFCGIGYFTQQLLDFKPGSNPYSGTSYSKTTTDLRPDCTAGFLYLNPGIAFSINDQMRLVFNAKILKEMVLQLYSGEFIVVSGLQMDFNF